MSQAQGGPGMPTSQAIPGVKNVVAVGAGKGGVGKSTASALLAVGLARKGLKVGLLDADIYGPSVPTLMGVAGQKPSVNEQARTIIPVESKGVKLISIGFMVDPKEAVVWRGPMVHGVVQQFLQQVEWGELDYLVVDLPPGTGDVPLTLSQSIPMTGSVVVCTPQDIALQDARRAVKMYETLNVPSLGVVENMSFYVCPQCGHRDEIFDCGGAEQAAGSLGVPFLGAVPLNACIRRFCDAGTTEKVFEPAEAGEHVPAAVEAVIDAVIAQVDKRNSSAAAMPTLSIE